MSKTRSEFNEWILPAEIPFDMLRRRDLEECVYWLLDAMGAKDLEWRTGGTGDGAPDGGRDLEAFFYSPAMDGDTDAQKWWIECKGRAGTVAPDEVRSAVLNAANESDLDYLVLVTNTQFSNPTRDWVKKWQRTHQRPKIRLWDRVQLERFLSRHPDVVMRLFSSALSLEGRIQALNSRFWNRMEFAPPSTLADIWKSRHSLQFEPMEMFAIIANEAATGDIIVRPWAAILEPDSALQVLALAAQNAIYLVYRSSLAGVDQRILIRALAYLLLAALKIAKVKEVWTLLHTFSTHGEKGKFSRKIEEIVVLPIIGQLQSELQVVCASNCKRIITTRQLEDEKDQVKIYWRRLDSEGIDTPKDERHLVLEKFDEPCAVGFRVNKHEGCPLFGLQPSLKTAERLLGVFQTVAEFRTGKSPTSPQ